MGANAQTTVPTFVASQVLTADQQNQSARTGVPVFATTVTRDAAFGGTGEKTLAEGQLCYIEGTSGGLQQYDGSAWITLGTGKWQTWTPTYQGFTVGNATVEARYIEIGNFGRAYVSITLGSTSSLSASVAWTISNPSTMSFAGIGVTTPIGQCELRDASANSYSGVVSYVDTTKVQPRYYSVSGSLISEATSVISNTPFTWTSTDILFAQWFYHKA